MVLAPGVARAQPVPPLCDEARPTSLLDAQTLRTSDRPPRAEIADYFSARDIRESRAYNGLANGLGYGALVVELIALLVLLLRYGRALGGWAMRVTGARWKRATLLMTAVTVCVPAIATLPFSIASHRHARAFGLATDTTWEHVVDVAKALGFAIVAVGIVALVFVGIARRAPRRWPVIVAAAAAVLTFTFVFLFPVVYEPAFNRFEPVDARTRARVLAVAEREGIAIADVVVSDASRRTTTLNAYVSGLGASRRVVLYDTLLDADLGCALEVVIAHELAHVKHGDVFRGTAIATAGAILGVFGLAWLIRRPRVRTLTGAEGAGDPRAVPIVIAAMVVASVLVAPAANWESRRIEARADRTALDVTQCPGEAIELQVALSRAALSDLNPHPVERWYAYTHPTVRERIQLAIDHAWRVARDGVGIFC